MPFDLVKEAGKGTRYVSNLTGKEAIRMLDQSGLATHRDYAYLFDDFLGDVIADQWSGAKGSDAEGVAPFITASTDGIGKVRLASGDAGTGTAADCSSLTHELNWRASGGGLMLEARIYLGSAASVCVNIGFTDVKATTTLEMPFTVSGTTITSNASDAVCFVYDTAQTTDQWAMLGVKADTDTAFTLSGVVPVSNTWNTYRIEIDSSGTAQFFIDDVLYHTVANAVTATTSLTPIVAIEARSTTAKSCDVDYIYVASQRR